MQSRLWVDFKVDFIIIEQGGCRMNLGKGKDEPQDPSVPYGAFRYFRHNECLYPSWVWWCKGRDGKAWGTWGGKERSWKGSWRKACKPEKV